MKLQMSDAKWILFINVAAPSVKSIRKAFNLSKMLHRCVIQCVFYCGRDVTMDSMTLK